MTPGGNPTSRMSSPMAKAGGITRMALSATPGRVEGVPELRHEHRLPAQVEHVE